MKCLSLRYFLKSKTNSSTSRRRSSQSSDQQTSQLTYVLGVGEAMSAVLIPRLLTRLRIWRSRFWISSSPQGQAPSMRSRVYVPVACSMAVMMNRSDPARQMIRRVRALARRPRGLAGAGFIVVAAVFVVVCFLQRRKQAS